MQRLTELKTMIPSIRYDLRYASKNNFTGKRLYPANTSRTFLRSAAARALKGVCETLNTHGYSLLVFDAYRPYSVTKRMWELIHDERYVANPAKGSGHNRGLAIDCTLLDEAGNIVDMGTPFDHFTDSAHHSFFRLPGRVINARRLLKTCMEQHGFRALETEWWHYAWPNDRNYHVLDLQFREVD